MKKRTMIAVIVVVCMSVLLVGCDASATALPASADAPAKPVAEQKPQTDAAQPDDKPAAANAAVEQATAAPAQPDPAAKQPAAKPAESAPVAAQPTEASAVPDPAAAQPAEAPAEPDQAAAQPAEASAEPDPAVAQPVEAPAELDQAAAQPAEAPAEPDQAVAHPVEAAAMPPAPVEAPAEAPAVTPAPVNGNDSAAVLNAGESTLTVNATESVKKTPDVAYLNLGVRTQGRSAEIAQQQNARQVTALIEALKAQGIAEEDIETAYVNLYQDYEDKTSYIMDNTLKVTVRKIDTVGEVLDAAIKAGANQSYSFSFGLENWDAAYLEALGNAMKSVGAKAQAVAESGGYSIVRPKSIEEGGSSSYYMPMAESAAMESAADLGGGYTTPIAPGDIEVSASVSGTYVIQ